MIKLVFIVNYCDKASNQFHKLKPELPVFISHYKSTPLDFMNDVVFDYVLGWFSRVASMDFFFFNSSSLTYVEYVYQAEYFYQRNRLELIMQLIGDGKEVYLAASHFK